MALPDIIVTNFPTPLNSTCSLLLGDANGFTVLAHCTGTPPTTANIFAHGALISQGDTGTGVNAVYQNTGSSAVPAWVLLDTGAGFSLPVTATDSTSTTGTSFETTMSGLTTGTGIGVSAPALTTGNAFVAQAAAGTLTTGRYYSANDGATEVFGIGKNGHVVSTQTTAPTIGTVTNQGISAAAVTAGSTDTAGKITTTGTQNNTADSVIPVVFNKAYDAAPKAVTLTPANSAAAGGNAIPGSGLAYVSLTSTTAFLINVTHGTACAATPAWFYEVIG